MQRTTSAGVASRPISEFVAKRAASPEGKKRVVDMRVNLLKKSQIEWNRNKPVKTEESTELMVGAKNVPVLNTNQRHVVRKHPTDPLKEVQTGASTHLQVP